MANTRARKSAAKTAATDGAASDLTFQNFLVELMALAEKYSNTVGAGQAVQEAAKVVAESDADEAQTETKPARGRKAKAAPVEEDVEDDTTEADDEDDTEADDGSDADAEAALRKLTLPALRKKVKALDIYDDEEVAAADKDTLIEALLDADNEPTEEDDDADADDVDDTDDETDDDLEARRDELLAMNLGDLRKLAREDYDATPAELKGLDKDAIVDLILDAGDDDDDDTAPTDESDEEGYTEDDLEAMDEAELLEVIEEWELEAPKKVRPASKYLAALRKVIFDAQYED